MQNVNLGTVGTGGPELSLLAAALILTLGIWRGRRDLGQRAALGVLATLAGIMVLNFLGLLLIQQSPGAPSLVTLMGFSLVSLIVSFLPLYVAANWAEIILRETRPEFSPDSGRTGESKGR